jgi:MarR family
LNDEIEDWMTVALLRAIVALVRREGADLSARHIGVFLICHLEDDAQTVRGLAARLNISRTAVSRALNRLSEFDLVRWIGVVSWFSGRRWVLGSYAISKEYSLPPMKPEACPCR